MNAFEGKASGCPRCGGALAYVYDRGIDGPLAVCMDKGCGKNWYYSVIEKPKETE